MRRLAYASVKRLDPGAPICTVVDNAVVSDLASEIAPVEKSTTKVTDAVCVAADVAETKPASEEAPRYLLPSRANSCTTRS